MRRSLLLLAILIAPLSASPGCGGGNGVWITGKLLKGGTQYAPPKDQLVTITFVAVETQDPSGKKLQGGDPYQADYDPESGTFSVPGPDRRGIPPGKYRVAVTQRLIREAFDAAQKNQKTKAKKRADRDTDTLGNRFGISNSPISVEVSRSEDVTIDLDQSTGSPKP
jgi:hypothetical protein